MTRDVKVEQFYTPEEVAIRLRVDVSTVYRWIKAGARSRGKDGLFPVVKLGPRCVRVAASVVNRFLARMVVGQPEALAA